MLLMPYHDISVDYQVDSLGFPALVAMAIPKVIRGNRWVILLSIPMAYRQPSGYKAFVVVLRIDHRKLHAAGRV